MVTLPRTAHDDGSQGPREGTLDGTLNATQHSDQFAHTDQNSARPVPSFWNFVDKERRHDRFASNNNDQAKPMRHHA